MKCFNISTIVYDIQAEYDTNLQTYSLFQKHPKSCRQLPRKKCLCHKDTPLQLQNIISEDNRGGDEGNLTNLCICKVSSLVVFQKLICAEKKTLFWILEMSILRSVISAMNIQRSQLHYRSCITNGMDDIIPMAEFSWALFISSSIQCPKCSKMQQCTLC